MKFCILEAVLLVSTIFELSTSLPNFWSNSAKRKPGGVSIKMVNMQVSEPGPNSKYNISLDVYKPLEKSLSKFETSRLSSSELTHWDSNAVIYLSTLFQNSQSVARRPKQKTFLYVPICIPPRHLTPWVFSVFLRNYLSPAPAIMPHADACVPNLRSALWLTHSSSKR